MSLIVLVTTAIHGMCHGDSRDLTLTARAAFEGMGSSAMGGSSPWIIEAGNRGENTRGQIVIRSRTITIRHPIELPRGSKKRFYSYIPDLSTYSDASIELETTQGSLAFPLPVPGESFSEHICLIGGNSGDMTFFRVGDVETYTDRFRDVYAKPGSLPDRSVGYSACGIVILGEGAERMSDSEVEALKGWVVTGGTLVFLGGASVPLLQDSRWRGFLPVGSTRRANVSSLSGIEKLAGSAAPAGTISLTFGEPVEGASAVFSSGGRDLITEKRVGLGFVSYVAFDPFQPPLKQWRGLKKLFTNGFNVNRMIENRMLVVRHLGGSEESTYYPGADAIDSPFNVKLPSGGTVLLILFAHLLISVPLNFYVMRRIGKGELAWITTPLISVAFAAVFFGLAAGLYEAGQSTRSKGILIASSLHPVGEFKGASELFIPRGGRYDLQIQSIDSIGILSGEYYYPSDSGSLEVIDDGQVRVPDLLVPNLAFREFQYSQRVAVGGLMSLDGKRTRGGRLELRLINNSGYALENAEVHYLGKVFPLGRVEPGGGFRGVVEGRAIANTPWSQDKVMILSSGITGFRPGPQIGSDIGSNIELLYVGGAPK